MIFLDTHVVVWLSAGDTHLLAGSEALLRGRRPLISPMVVLEMHFLHEIGRTKTSPDKILARLRDQIGLGVSDHPFADVIVHAAKIGWTRDPFDRVIVGHAIAVGAQLCTADRLIREQFAGAVWGKPLEPKASSEHDK